MAKLKRLVNIKLLENKERGLFYETQKVYCI